MQFHSNSQAEELTDYIGHFTRRAGFLFMNRGRYQLALALFLSVVLPTFFRTQIIPGSFNQGIINTLLVNVGMLTAGFLLWRQVNRFPSVVGALYVLWSFVPLYSVALIGITLLRLDYNRFLLFSCFIISPIVFAIIQIVQHRYTRLQFMVIPGGNVERVTNISMAQWILLMAPELPSVKSGKFLLANEGAEFLKSIADSSRTVVAGRNGIVADLRFDHEPEWDRFIAKSTLDGLPIYHYKQIEERLTGKVSIDHLSENNFGSVLPDSAYLKIRQAIDVGVALLTLPIALPLMLIIAIVIRLKEGSAAMFKQQRMGYRGKPFVAYKFRTMKPVAPSKNSDDKDVSWAMTKDDDDRITPLGRFLRRSRLDELPQILNIIKGEMSWIGPRPEVKELSEHYESQISFYAYRHAVRPGITGWAQVKQGHVTSVSEIDEKLKYDFFYIKNISVWLDFLIVLETINTILFGKGAR